MCVHGLQDCSRTLLRQLVCLASVCTMLQPAACVVQLASLKNSSLRSAAHSIAAAPDTKLRSSNKQASCLKHGFSCFRATGSANASMCTLRELTCSPLKRPLKTGRAVKHPESFHRMRARPAHQCHCLLTSRADTACGCNRCNALQHQQCIPSDLTMLLFVSCHSQLTHSRMCARTHHASCLLLLPCCWLLPPQHNRKKTTQRF